MVQAPVTPSRNLVRRLLGTRMVSDEVFTDSMETAEIEVRSGFDVLWGIDEDFTRILREGSDLESVRDETFLLIERRERQVFDPECGLHVLEKSVVRECARVLRSVFGPINEKTTGVSALSVLLSAARDPDQDLEHVSPGFVLEFIHLVLGLNGRSGLYGDRGQVPEFLKMDGREAAAKRTEKLDEVASMVRERFVRYPSGLEEDVIDRRVGRRDRILAHLGGEPGDWDDWEWQVQHVIKDASTLASLVVVDGTHRKAIAKAVENRIPFGITPYYLGLMDEDPDLGLDHAVRAQVIPPVEYVESMVQNKDARGIVFDFMGEHDTSPVDLVTRRYPLICILKPFNTCPQICVYCQRNWEIDECMAPDAMAPEDLIESALEWLDRHPGVGEVLVTGGDPMVMPDEAIAHLFDALASRDQLFRIRIGSRTPVTLPMRWTDDVVKLVSSYHEPGKREVCVVTHFSHSYEITPAARDAVQRIRRTGMGVYNQEVFTIENGRRFESAKLRRDLRLIGVDPYYTFNAKGKEETRHYMLPIARILQERKEEARLLPGLDRTDEPVFNVPRLGKNHLRAWQDHRVVMIRPSGARVYELHPWEKFLDPVPPYNYRDKPIYEFLREIEARGEDPADYGTIWYYY